MATSGMLLLACRLCIDRRWLAWSDNKLVEVTFASGPSSYIVSCMDKHMVASGANPELPVDDTRHLHHVQKRYRASHCNEACRQDRHASRSVRVVEATSLRLQTVYREQHPTLDLRLALLPPLSTGFRIQDVCHTRHRLNLISCLRIPSEPEDVHQHLLDRVECS